MERARGIRVHLMAPLRPISAARPHSAGHNSNRKKSLLSILLAGSNKSCGCHEGFFLCSSCYQLSRFLSISIQYRHNRLYKPSRNLTTTYSNLNVTEARVRISSMQCDARNLKRSPATHRPDARASLTNQLNNQYWTIPACESR